MNKSETSSSSKKSINKKKSDLGSNQEINEKKQEFKVSKKNFFNKRLDIDELINFSNYEEFSSSSINYDDDIKKFSPYEIKSYIKINSKIHEPDNIFFIYKKSDDDDLKYIGFEHIPPILWYDCSKGVDIERIMNIYDNQTYPSLDSYTKKIRAYIGNNNKLNLTFRDFEKYILLSPFCENNYWYPQCESLNKKNIINKKKNNTMSTFDFVTSLSDNLEENNEIYVYSRFSKSLIKFENHNGHYLVEIRYKSIANDSTEKLVNEFKHFPSDMPVDIVSFLNNFIFMTIESFLSLDIIQPIQIDVCMLLANDIDQMTYLKNRLDIIKDKYDNDTNKYIKIVLVKLGVDKAFSKLEASGIYDKLGKLVDEIIEKTYDECNKKHKENKSITDANSAESNNDLDDVKQHYILDLISHKMKSILLGKFD